MKTVVDTNVLISGIFFDGLPARILNSRRLFVRQPYSDSFGPFFNLRSIILKLDPHPPFGCSSESFRKPDGHLPR